jgi:pimeloyl-ACP methyl ester carboxylesterase
MIGRASGRGGLANSFNQIFGPRTRPSESALDDFWSLIERNDGTRILHKLIGYIPQRRRLRDRWVAAMQRDDVPLRVIDGEVDPISGAHMVERYHQLVPHADTVLLAGIGHYPQIEAPVQVLRHYQAFREHIGQQSVRAACS